MFKNDRAYAAYMRSEHVLSAWDVSREILFSIQSVKTAFDGAVRAYDLVPMENEVDLLVLFGNKIDNMEELIQQST